MRRGGVAFGLLLLSGIAFTAEPVRAYVAPDGSVRLWLKEAPSVTATDQAGWQIVPKAAETNATWLSRLKKIYPEEPGSPWKPLLEDVRAMSERAGVQMVRPSGTITVSAPLDGKVTVTAGPTTASFTQASGGWKSAQVGALDAWLHQAAPGAKTLVPLYRFASQSMPANATAADAWSVFLDSATRSTTTKPLIFEGNQPVVIELKPPAPATPPKTNPTPDVKTDAKTDTKPKESEASPWLLVGLAAVAGLGLGYCARAAQKPKGANSAPPDDAALKHRIASSSSEVDRLVTDLERAKAALAETTRASKQYRDEHNAWVRDRDETLRTLQDERTNAARAVELAGLLKAAEDAKNRTEGELARQIQALQGKVQGQETRAATLATKARAYTGLHKEVMDAFNFLQGEIGRPEVAAVVGYLLNYSVANLMDTLLAPNPALERAMLSNISRIAGCVSNLPHVRKAAATADGLLAGLGAGAITESGTPHPYATHIGGLLRIIRNQLNVEVAPFYVAVDGEGKAHAVYI